MTALLLRSASRARVALLGVGLLLCGFQLVIIGQAVAVHRANAFGNVASLLPAFLQRGLGNKAMLLATFKGTVAFGYFHPVVCMLVAMFVIYVATEIAHEVEAGLVDLELARAVPRHRLVTRSLLLAHAGSAAIVALMALGTWLGVRIFGAQGLDLPTGDERLRLLANLFALGSCFCGFALLVASTARRWVSAFTLAALTTVVAYIVDFLALGWRAMEPASRLSPFHYYPALSIIAGDAPTARDLAVLLTAGLLMSAAAYWQFQRRDL